jgi:hypothetical protein
MQSHNAITETDGFTVVTHIRKQKSKIEKNFIQPSDYIIPDKDKYIKCVTMTIIVKNENNYYGLFSLRHANTKDGYITSQGGKVNRDKKESPLYASLRETWEEVGIDDIKVSDIKLLFSQGDFNHYYVILDKFPVVRGTKQGYYEYYNTNKIKEICQNNFLNNQVTPIGLIWIDIKKIKNIDSKYFLDVTLQIIDMISNNL